MTTALDIRRLYVQRRGVRLSNVSVSSAEYVEAGEFRVWSAVLEARSRGGWLCHLIEVGGKSRRKDALDALYEHVNTAFPAVDANQVRHALYELIAEGQPNSMPLSRWQRIQNIARAVEAQADWRHVKAGAP
jgi:hypothetical protein